MGGVDEAPFRPQPDIVEKPLHRARAEAGLHLLHLVGGFRDVDVQPRLGVDGTHAGERRPRLVGRDRAQRMQRQPDSQAGMRGAAAAQGVDERQILVHRMDEALLRLLDRLADAAMGIQHRQQRQPQPGARGGGDQPVRHLGRVGVVRAAGPVVDVVELAHRRHAEMQHLQIDQRRDRLVVLGRQAIDHPVHLLAPGPQIVLGPGGGDEFGASGERALEGVRVQVGQPRHAVARQPLHRPLRAGCGDREDRAVVADFEIAGREPAVGLVQVLDLVDRGHCGVLLSVSAPERARRSRPARIGPSTPRSRPARPGS